LVLELQEAKRKIREIRYILFMIFKNRKQLHEKQKTFLAGKGTIYQ